MVFNAYLFSEILLFIALSAIYLGFAGFLGSLLYRARRRLNWLAQTGLFGLALLVFLALGLAVPAEDWLSRGQLLAAFGLVLLFSLRPFSNREWMWRTSLAFRYLAFTLLLVVFWSISGEPDMPRLLLAPLAGLAAIMAWQRSREKPEDLLAKRFQEVIDMHAPVSEEPVRGKTQGSRGAV